MKRYAGLLLALLLAAAEVIAGVDDDVAQVRQGWEQIRYQLPASEQEEAMEKLARQAERVMSADSRSSGSRFTVGLRIWRATRSTCTFTILGLDGFLRPLTPSSPDENQGAPRCGRVRNRFALGSLATHIQVVASAV
jgi:hypothetical protein